jgi:hypothetical protein
LSTPDFLWAFYPALGWFIGLSLHITSYILYARGVYPMAKRAFIYHLVAYISVMMLLIAINANIMNYTFQMITWVLYPMISWGDALFVHGIIYKMYFSAKLTKDGEMKTKKDKAVEKEMERLRRKLEQDAH